MNLKTLIATFVFFLIGILFGDFVSTSRYHQKASVTPQELKQERYESKMRELTNSIMQTAKGKIYEISNYKTLTDRDRRDLIFWNELYKNQLNELKNQ